MNAYEKIRAALEQAGEYIRSDLASERGAFEGHEGVSRIDEIKVDLANNSAALAALAELEKSAAEPRLFTAGEMFDAHEDGATHRAEWQRSDTFKLIQERTK